MYLIIILRYIIIGPSDEVIYTLFKWGQSISFPLRCYKQSNHPSLIGRIYNIVFERKEDFTLTIIKTQSVKVWKFTQKLFPWGFKFILEGLK